MKNNMLYTKKAIAFGCVLIFISVSCKLGQNKSSKGTPVAAVSLTANTVPVAPGGVVSERDTTPGLNLPEPPPPPPPSPKPYSVGYIDTSIAKDVNIELKEEHITGVKVNVTNDTVILTGNAGKQDLKTILAIANEFHPKKVINKIVVQ